MIALSQKAKDEIAAAEGWVSGHWRMVAIASLITNAVLGAIILAVMG